MAIDIRAKTSCNLGPLISASISDDYVQGNGLIKTTGNCEIAALVSPRMGSEISFSYSTGSITKKIPKVLRVVSSFADPFRNITSVEFACPLAYMEDVTEPIRLDAFGDPINTDVTEEDRQNILLRVSAQWVGQQCLAAIGIQGALPLTNIFTSDGPFDLSAGYVSVLSDLLISESYCGYIGPDGKLKTFSLANVTGSGRLITEDDIIDVGPLNFGQLPGDTVTVNYSTLQLAGSEDEGDPEDQGDPAESENPIELTEEARLKLNWELETEESAPEETILSGSYIPLLSNLTSGEWEETYVFSPTRTIVTEYDNLDRVARRTTTTTDILAKKNSSYVNEYTSYNRVPGIGGVIVNTVEVEEKIYRFNYIPPPTTNEEQSQSQAERSRGYDDVIYEVKKTYEPEALALAGVPLNYYGRDIVNDNVVEFFYSANTSSAPEDLILVEQTEVYYETYARDFYESTPAGGRIFIGYFPSTKTTTAVSKIFGKTSNGQNYFNKKKESEDTYTMREGAVEALKLKYIGSSSRIVHGRESIMEGRPTQAQRLLANRQKESARTSGEESTSAQPSEASATNGPRTEQKTEIELIYTDGKSGRKIEFNMPYAPDDTFIRAIYTPPSNVPMVRYRAIKGAAAARASLFGRVQNSLLMGNRHGISLQLPVDLMPPEPFSKLVVQAKGITGVYATNGTSWTLDSNGIIASTDALLLGVAGKA